MSYNRKIIRTNSYIEIWEYEKIIFSHNTKDDNFSEKSDKRNKRRNFDELTPEEQKERLKRLSKTRKNAKWELLRLVDTNFDDKTSFLTLTTKENIDNRNEFNLLFDKFIKRLNYKIYHSKKRLIKYIAVLERQKRGAWHAHILLFDFPFIPHHELLETWGLGAVRINKVDVDSKENRGRYVTKYFEKGIGQEILESLGKKAYYSSRNLIKPEVIKIIDNDTIDDLVKSELILYETEYDGKVYRSGEILKNHIKYKKIKIEE